MNKGKPNKIDVKQKPSNKALQILGVEVAPGKKAKLIENGQSFGGFMAKEDERKKKKKPSKCVIL